MSPEFLDGIWAASPELLTARAQPGRDACTIVPWHVDGSPKSPSGVVVFHALSPLGDTTLLLASLGQARRLACVLGKPLSVVLLEADIAENNRMVSLLGAAHLRSNCLFREQLYAAIGAQTRSASLKNLPDEGAEALWERAHWVHARGDDGNFDPERSGATEAVVRRELLACLRAHFNATDRQTAFYFLAQRHHQHRYADQLKLGNPRERRFDEAAHRLDRVEYGAARGVRSALYISDYAVGRSCRTAMTMHAYCFPSGTAFERSQSVEFCRSIALHLCDLADARRAEAAFLALRPPHDARFLADLLSFIHFYGAERGSPAPVEIERALREVDAAWAQSWIHYSVSPELFRHRTLRWFAAHRSGESAGAPPPYHLFPWLLSAPERRERLLRVALAATRWLVSNLTILGQFEGGCCAAGLALG